MPRAPKNNGVQPAHDAVIFVPSIGNEWSDQSLELIAEKMSRALALQEDGRIQYSIDLQDEDKFGSGEETVKFYSVSRSDPKTGSKETFFDLYEMNYRSLLIDDFVSKTLLAKSVVVLLTVISNVARVFRAFFRSFAIRVRPPKPKFEKGKDQQWVEAKRQENATGLSWVAKLQALYALVIFSMISAYMLLLFFSAAGIIVVTVVRMGQPEAGNPFDLIGALQGVVNTPLGSLASLYLAIVTLVAGVTHNQVREFILGVIVDYICMVDYINDDPDEGQKRNLVAQLQNFLDQISSYGDGRYKRYIIVSYSFGSIVALDTLFPKAERKRSAVVDQAAVLFTIGSPFDLIRSFWNNYFEQRNVCEIDLKWWNIYSRLDLLGSNFRNDDKAEDPHESYIFKSGELCATGFKPKNIRYGGEMPIKLSFRFLLLYALRAHSVYWDKKTRNSDAFEHVIRLLYPPPNDHHERQLEAVQVS